ncbi:uncharacterized protein LOC144123628 [Amblyomma americanum]
MEQQQLIKKEGLKTPVPLATPSAICFRLKNKKAIVLLVFAVVILGCALAANMIHMYWTPSITVDATTWGQSDDYYLPLPASAPPSPAAAAAPGLAVVMEVPAPFVDSAVASPDALIQAISVEQEATAMLVVSTEDGNGPDANETRQQDARCLEPAQMTVCTGEASQWPAFFFDGRRCLTPESVPPPGCLEGANRFRSLGHCRGACQGQGVRAECREQMRLVPCSRQHVKRSWFYPSNGSCVEWGFPEGNCVSVGVPLFQSLQQCLLDCVHNDAPACREFPVAQRCGEYQVNFPVYSAENKNGRFDCLTVDPTDKLCLLGRNVFPSYRACAHACLVS